MAIEPKSGTMLLGELISAMQSGKIRVNRTYQRSGGIWPLHARSFLVETVLLKMPIPRVLLHVLDAPRPPHEMDIIDGQQRCSVLRRFREGKFALTGSVDNDVFEGKRFVDLAKRQRDILNTYAVPVDRYSGLSSREIREVFRRLNYYTAPLNAAEQRHAQFVGELSGFVESQARLWNSSFRRFETFTKRKLARKGDEQLMAEVVAAMLKGITTPNAKSLRDVYKEFNTDFPSTAQFKRRLDQARATLDSWKELRANTLMRKHYQVFSLLLALMHAQSGLVAVRADLGPVKQLLDVDAIVKGMQRLEDAVDARPTTGPYAGFSSASETKTNVRENRLTRCRYFYATLTGASVGGK